MFRHSCGKCHFCNTTRPSDITIADFWGWEKTDTNFNADDKGVNLVLINTEKGRWLFEAIQNDLNVIPADIENCLQPNLQHPSAIHPKRMAFEKLYAKKGFEVAMKRYGDYDWSAYVKKRILFLKKVIKRIIKSICK